MPKHKVTELQLKVQFQDFSLLLLLVLFFVYYFFERERERNFVTHIACVVGKVIDPGKSQLTDPPATFNDNDDDDDDDAMRVYPLEKALAKLY